MRKTGFPAFQLGVSHPAFVLGVVSARKPISGGPEAPLGVSALTRQQSKKNETGVSVLGL